MNIKKHPYQLIFVIPVIIILLIGIIVDYFIFILYKISNRIEKIMFYIENWGN